MAPSGVGAKVGAAGQVGLAALIQGIDRVDLHEHRLSSLGLEQCLGERAAALELEGELAALMLANIVAAAPHVTFSHRHWATQKREFNSGSDLPSKPRGRPPTFSSIMGPRTMGPFARLAPISVA